MNELREWTLAERLLDEVIHEPKLALEQDWKYRATNALPGCPKNYPEGTYAGIKK